jgi:hypothetical protein
MVVFSVTQKGGIHEFFLPDGCFQCAWTQAAGWQAVVAPKASAQEAKRLALPGCVARRNTHLDLVRTGRSPG